MSTTRSVALSALNIVTHPHTSSGYVDLFADARKLKQSVKIWGDTHGMLWSWFDLEEDGEIYTGEVFTYSEIDMDQDWLDLAKGEAATAKQRAEITIPEHLKPQFKQIRFAFFPASHLWVFCEENAPDGSLGVSRMKIFLERLLNDRALLEGRKFTRVDVRLVQSKETIEQIFEEIEVKTLEILVLKPNDDSAGKAHQTVEEELEDENVSSYFIKKKAEPGQAIKPNESTIRYMDEAANNGYVEATGPDVKTGQKRTINTQAHPLVQRFEYDSRTGFLDFFVEAATKLAKKAKKKLRERTRDKNDEDDDSKN